MQSANDLGMFSLLKMYKLSIRNLKKGGVNRKKWHNILRGKSKMTTSVFW